MTGKAQRPSKYKITEQINTRTGTKSLHQQNCLKLTALIAHCHKVSQLMRA